MRKKKTKSRRKQLVKKLDDVFAEYIRLRYPKCVICGKEPSQCGHVITRSAYSIRWDERNAFGQCRGCNMVHEYRPYIYYDWYINNFGAEAFAELVRDSRKVRKYYLGELELMIEEYKEKIKKLKENM